MSVGIEQWSGGMATGHWNRRLDGAEQWSWGSDVAATDGDRNVDGFWCRLGHWTLVLLGALIGYRCSLGRCRGLVLVGPLEVLVLTGSRLPGFNGGLCTQLHAGVSRCSRFPVSVIGARSCMQRPHPDEVTVARRPASGYGLGVRLRGRVHEALPVLRCRSC